MPAKAKLKRKSFLVAERALHLARKALGVKTDAGAVRLSVERIAEMGAFWQFMKNLNRNLETSRWAGPAGEGPHAHGAGRGGEAAYPRRQAKSI